MSLKPLDLKEFSFVSKSQWESLATDQLKGANPNENLGWSTSELELFPYYDASDVKEFDYITDFFSTLCVQWKLYEKIEVEEESRANEQALEALKGGCDGIIFSMQKKPSFDPLLKDILTDICDVSILYGESGLLESEVPEGLKGFKYLEDHSDIYVDEGRVFNIASVENCIRHLGDCKHILRKASSDFFFEIASLRALRFLLKDVLNKDPLSIQIHTLIPEHEEEDSQWFLNSTAGLASVLGGTNSVSFTTAVGNNRISRNVGNLIREESGIDVYSDQCGGSYFVETLTHTIIKTCKKSLIN